MRPSTTVVVLLASGVQACQADAEANDTRQGYDLDKFVDKFVSNLLDRALEAMPANHADLDGTTLGKSGQISVSPQSSVNSHLPLRTPLHPTVCSTGLPHLGCRLQSHNFAQRPQYIRGDMRAAANPLLKKEFGQEVEEDVEKRIEEGKMTFEDFMKAMDMIGKMRGLTGVMRWVPGLKQVMPTKEQLDAAQLKTRQFKKILGAMTKEEIETPDLFYDGSEGPRIERIVEKSGHKLETVERFLFEFKQMRFMMSRLAKGEKAEDIEKEMLKDGVIPEGNRADRKKRQKEEAKMERAERAKETKKVAPTRGFR